tara:strand:+ start:4074 stop:4250 length:177 start_codon:yes stop_codon:yes gene_type:complete
MMTNPRKNSPAVAYFIDMASNDPARFAILLGWAMTDEDINTAPIDKETLKALYPKKWA